MAQTEFVYFDLGNVICMFSHSRACRQMAAVSGVAEEQVWDIVFAGSLQSQYETGRIDSREFYEEFCRMTGSAPSMNELLLAGSDIFSLNYRIMPLVTQLSSISFPIGILSNTCEAHWNFICQEYPSILKLFSRIILSFEVKSAKPDPPIYQAAINLAGVAADRIVFADDKPENVGGAHACGMDAILFENAHQLNLELLDRHLEFNL